MGSPKDLNVEQIAKLNELTRDLAETNNVVHSGNNATIEVSIPMNSNDIVLVTLVPKLGSK